MTVLLSPTRGVIAVPFQERLQSLFPNAATLDYEGEKLIALPHGVDETRVLRNMGIDAPSPVLSQYDWCGGDPFDVQRKTSAMLTLNRRAYVLNSMGTGKTRAALWAWDFLNKQGKAGKLLVVAPRSTLRFTWGNEVFTTLPGRRIAVLQGTRQKRRKLLSDKDIDIYIINHDGMSIIADDLASRPDIDTVVLDELAVYRNGSTTRAKVTRKVTERMQWLWGMTGQPTPREPVDAWAQCRIITPHTVPKHFNRFRDETMIKISNFRWVPKSDALDRVLQVMQPAVRFSLEDVGELPDCVERVLEVELGPKQATIYKQLEDHAHGLVEGAEITALNAGAVLSKLLQISCGYVYARNGENVTLDNGGRLDALVEVIESTDNKVIVFVPFIHALDGILARLEAEGVDCRAVSGRTSDGDRSKIFNLFQNTSSVKVLVAHPNCMAHGLTLTAAATVVWFTATSDLEIFEQANARIRRFGQKNRQQIIMFSSTRAEASSYKRLRGKQKTQNALLDMFADMTG